MRSAAAWCVGGCMVMGMIGCGPLNTPMVVRLDEESQREINDSWRNMLTPPSRLDRQALLDTVILNQLHQRGVDTLRLVCTKSLDDGMVVMEIDFDRANEQADAFTITCVDAGGREIRREQFAFADVESSVRLFAGQHEIVGEGEELTPDQLAERERMRAERLARLRATTAATRPAAAELPPESE